MQHAASPMARPMSVPLLLASLSVAAACPVRSGTKVVVFSDVQAGTGKYSAQWERHFWNWWATNATDVPAHQFIDAAGIKSCSASQLLAAGTVMIPGGNAYTYTENLGLSVKRELTKFVQGGGLYIGTCAGWYYSSSGYYWEYSTGWSDAGYWHYPALLGIFGATVEGSITDIADEETGQGVFNGHALTRLSNGHKAIYYGGPTMGWKQTAESDKPDGSEVLARFADVGNSTGSAPPSIMRMRGAGSRVLVFSVHLEAYEGIGVSELPTADREANYMLRKALISAEMEMK